MLENPYVILICLIVFITIEKIVLITPCKWDDILISAIKAAIKAVVKNKNLLPLFLCAFAFGALLFTSLGTTGCVQTKQVSEIQAYERAGLVVKALGCDLTTLATLSKSTTDVDKLKLIHEAQKCFMEYAKLSVTFYNTGTEPEGFREKLREYITKYGKATE